MVYADLVRFAPHMHLCIKSVAHQILKIIKKKSKMIIFGVFFFRTNIAPMRDIVSLPVCKDVVVADEPIFPNDELPNGADGGAACNV